MAKSRKPAIANVARPEGFLDDIVRPIIQKNAKKVADVSFTSNLPRKTRANITRSANQLEEKTMRKRNVGYIKDMQKALKKKNDKAFSVASAKSNAIHMEQGRRIGRKSWAKPKTVRQAAKSARKMYR